MLALAIGPRPIAAGGGQGAARLYPGTLLLSPDLLRPWLHAATPAAAMRQPVPARVLRASLRGRLLVIARRRIAGSFMHAHEDEAGCCHCGRN